MLGLAARMLLVGTCCSVFLVAQSRFAGGGAHAPTISNSLGGHAFAVPRGTPASSGLIAPPSGFTGINPGALRSFGSNGFYNRSREGRAREDRGRVYPPVGYLWAPYYYPFYDYDPGFGPGYDSYGAGAPDPNLQGAMIGQNMLGEQVQRLTDELEQLRASQQAQGMVPSGPAPDTSSQGQQTPTAPPITLVLRNGQQVQVQSYAVMGATLWDFSSQPARKIPIANIDIDASVKATEASGGELPPLSAR